MHLNSHTAGMMKLVKYILGRCNGTHATMINETFKKFKTSFDFFTSLHQHRQSGNRHGHSGINGIKPFSSQMLLLNKPSV
jgi:hypothetical protein